MSNERMSLDQLGIKFGTDKASPQHDYLSFYENYFQKFRDKPIKIVEIGILNGASIKMWSNYFRLGTIIGCDIKKNTTRFAGGRTIVEILDQSNIQELVDLGVKHGPFDIIIEDGSHKWEHQITTLRTLYPFLKEGGIYVAEDLQTNYGSMQNDYRGVSSITCVEYLKKALDIRVSDSQTDISKEEDAFLRTYARSMNLSFYKKLCLIEKKYKKIDRVGTPSGKPLWTPARDRNVLPVSVMAHIGHVGNVVGESGSVRSQRVGAYIQGFTLNVAEDIQDSLQYKARLDDGSWTNWMKTNEFAGTQSQSRDLTGFSVRLTDLHQDALELTAVGEFKDQTDLSVVSANEECVSTEGSAQMCGMQVVLSRRDIAAESTRLITRVGVQAAL